MFKMESELVNEDFLERTDVYNLKSGGFGGWDYINKNGLNKTCGDSFKWYIEKLKDEEFRKLDYTIKSERAKRFINEGKIIKFNGQERLGIPHTEETKKKIGEKSAVHQNGEGNSQFGTMWIYNLELKENKKIKKDEFSSWEQDGWLKGRKMKF